MPNNKKRTTKTRVEILEAKRKAERERYRKIKNDPIKYKAQQEKEKEKYLRKKEKGTIKSIQSMTPRQQRAQKKIWRESKAKYRQNMLKKRQETQQYLEENSPPVSDNEEPPALITTPVSRPLIGLDNTPQFIKRKLSKYRKEKHRQLKSKDQEIENLKKEVKKLRKKCSRLNNKGNSSKNEISPNSTVSKILSTSRKNIHQVLLGGEILKRQLASNYNSTKSHKIKQVFIRMITGKIIKKYRIQSQFKNFLKYKSTQKIFSNTSPLNCHRKCKKLAEARRAIRDFLESDISSRMCPGKKDFVKKNGVIQQKRFLNNSLKVLHSRFILSQPESKISYSFFCKCCPFWIKSMNINDRDTCKCVIHENFDLLLKAMFENKMIDIKSSTELIAKVCCDKVEVKCLKRVCEKCKHNNITFRNNNGDPSIGFYQWGYVKEKYMDHRTKKMKISSRTEKKKIDNTKGDLMKIFEKQLNTYLNHETNILHQHLIIKQMKNELTKNDCLIHIDFSENYNLKFCDEIQSFHFGGSRKQITIHTGVVYYKNNENNLKKDCFATLSESLLHNAPAIFAHLQPIFEYLSKNTGVKNVNFLSDGPSTQYKNKTMFLLLAQKLQSFYPSLIKFTWNYTETGHGKGAPDGVGGTIKRMADKAVSNGADIPDFKCLMEKLPFLCRGIKIFEINVSDIDKISSIIPDKNSIPSLAGTQKVRQIRGAKNTNKLEFFSLSYLDSSDLKNTYKIGEINYKKNFFDCSGIVPIQDDDSESDFDEIYKNWSKKLNYSDIYTDSSGNLSNSPMQIKAGTYLLIEYLVGQKKLRYAAIAQENADEGEVKIIGLKKYGKDRGVYRSQQNIRRF